MIFETASQFYPSATKLKNYFDAARFIYSHIIVVFLIIDALYNFKFSLDNAEVMSFKLCKFKPNKQIPYEISGSDFLWSI